jgi:2'-5' RNA ligase
MRAFVAVDLLPGPELAALEVRLPPHFHATLRFFPELPKSDVATLTRAMDAAAGRVAPFDLELRGIGAFPSPRDPRVVWVGFGEGRAPLERLARELAESLRALGIPPDPRGFEPHATLSRVRGPRDRGSAHALLSLGPDRPFGVQPVVEIVAYESRLAPSGAEHRRIAAARLVGPP